MEQCRASKELITWPEFFTGGTPMPPVGSPLLPKSYLQTGLAEDLLALGETKQPLGHRRPARGFSRLWFQNQRSKDHGISDREG